jgi:methionyl-tRNA formyltransferase
MELVFMGTPEFAVPTLRALAAAGHRIRGVYTQPDKPAGRGGQMTAPPVKRAAAGLGLPVYQPAKIRPPEVYEELESLAPEAIVIVGYGKIIPQHIIDLPPHGCINLHASLLPKYRGAAPVNWAIIRGETVTGVTTMKIDAGLDTGDILLVREAPIGPDEDAVSLGRRLAELGAPLMLETLEGLERGTITPAPQDHSCATLAPILKKEDGLIDWSLDAQQIVNRVRGLAPWPGAYTHFRGQLLHLWKAVAQASLPVHQTSPGTLLVEGRRLRIACGQGTLLEAIEVQLEGRRRVPAPDFINGARIQPDEKVQ